MSEQLRLPLEPEWHVTIEPCDDGRIGVVLSGDGWTVATSYPTRKECEAWAKREAEQRSGV